MTLGPSPASNDVLGELSTALWCQRALIEVLQYRLQVQLLVTGTGNERHLQFAIKEVEGSIAEIREAESTRDLAARKSAIVLGIAENSPLTKIKEAAPEPWSSALGDHQTALLGLVNETERLSKKNRELALRGSNETKALFEAITGSVGPSPYERPGTKRGLAAPPALIDREA